MERSRLVSELICYVDNDIVAFGSSDGRNRPLAIDTDCWSIKYTIGVRGDPGYVEVICDSCSIRETEESSSPSYGQDETSHPRKHGEDAPPCK